MKYYLQSAQFLAFFANAVPIIVSIIYYSQGGDDWGGKLPFFVNMSLIMMMIGGAFGIGIMGRVIYLLNVNKNYSGNQGSIRATIFVALFYMVIIIMSGISISKYAYDSSDKGCSVQSMINVWDQDDYESGQQAYSNFCHQCKCKINESNLKYYTKNQLNSLNYSTVDGASDISQCKPEEGQLQTSSFHKFKIMEKSFQCAGFCSSNLIFTFLGTSQGIPNDETGCYQQVQLEFSKMRTVLLVLNICLFFLMIIAFTVSVYLRKIRIKEIMDEYGLRLYEPINSISVIGVSNEDWRIGDYVSQSDQQKSNNSNKNYMHVTTNYKNNTNDNSSNFGQSQQLDRNSKMNHNINNNNINNNESINKMKSVRQAFRSMHNPKSTFKK